MPRGENLTADVRRKGVEASLASGRGYRYDSAAGKRAGAKGGKASAKTRRTQSMERTIAAVLRLYSDKVRPLPEDERQRAVRLMAVAWRQGYKVGRRTKWETK